MSVLETVKIDDGKDGVIINKSDFDPKVHKLHKDENKDALDSGMTDVEKKAAAELEAKRKAEANRGITTGGTMADSTRNPSGTYSEPTPTDIRYPDKNATEFESNHGAFVGKSAAQMRESMGLPDEPGGIVPTQTVARGPQGLFYVMQGKERVSKGFKTEEEASAYSADNPPPPPTPPAPGAPTPPAPAAPTPTKAA